MSERNIWWHWQNLNRGARDRVKGPPWHGRAWLHIGDEGARVEWDVISRSCGVSLSVLSDDDTWSGSFAVPPVAIYWGFHCRSDRLVARLAKWVAASASDMGFKWNGADLSLRFHDGSIWWNVFADDSGWTAKRPRWRDGNINLRDLLLGKAQYKSELLETREISVAMPERAYTGTCELREDSWTRRRGGRRVLYRAYIEMQEPIPFPGKGENSWDCGEDACHGMTCPAKTFAEAIAAITASVLRDRERRGGLDWRPQQKEAAE